MTFEELDSALQAPDEFIIIYKDPDFLQVNPDVSAHMYIIVPYSDDEVLLLAMITSSEFNRRVANSAMLECILDIREGEFDFIRKDSIIDCNQCFKKRKGELVSNGAKLKRCAKLPYEFIAKIKAAIKQSPVVKRQIKKHIL
jgi:hypothetical protein